MSFISRVLPFLLAIFAFAQICLAVTPICKGCVPGISHGCCERYGSCCPNKVGECPDSSYVAKDWVIFPLGARFCSDDSQCTDPEKCCPFGKFSYCHDPIVRKPVYGQPQGPPPSGNYQERVGNPAASPVPTTTAAPTTAPTTTGKSTPVINTAVPVEGRVLRTTASKAPTTASKAPTTASKAPTTAAVGLSTKAVVSPTTTTAVPTTRPTIPILNVTVPSINFLGFPGLSHGRAARAVQPNSTVAPSGRPVIPLLNITIPPIKIPGFPGF